MREVLREQREWDERWLQESLREQRQFNATMQSFMQMFQTFSGAMMQFQQRPTFLPHVRTIRMTLSLHSGMPQDHTHHRTSHHHCRLAHLFSHNTQADRCHQDPRFTLPKRLRHPQYSDPMQHRMSHHHSHLPPHSCRHTQADMHRQDILLRVNRMKKRKVSIHCSCVILKIS